MAELDKLTFDHIANEVRLMNQQIQEKHNAEIAKIERENVLNDLKEWGMSFSDHIYYEELLQKIESLGGK